MAVIGGLILGGVLMLPNAAGAHESRTVGDGKYEVVVGFLDEPAFSGQKNGLELRVATTPDSGTEAGAAAGAPVEGLEQTLHAEVIYGDQSMPLTLQARFGQPGAYAGWFFPMAAGDY
ncbi:MAG: hypothetical protein IT337_12975, partial [Thermomicrobiales bacterium]|nr:hypothetical protein [Thermomicrobiales bacterium]